MNLPLLSSIEREFTYVNIVDVTNSRAAKMERHSIYEEAT